MDNHSALFVGITDGELDAAFDAIESDPLTTVSITDVEDDAEAEARAVTQALDLLQFQAAA